MKKGWTVVTVLFIIIVLGVLALIFIPAPKVAQAPASGPSNVASSTPLR